jgi:hypothetical protein
VQILRKERERNPIWEKSKILLLPSPTVLLSPVFNSTSEGSQAMEHYWPFPLVAQSNGQSPLPESFILHSDTFLYEREKQVGCN